MVRQKGQLETSSGAPVSCGHLYPGNVDTAAELLLGEDAAAAGAAAEAVVAALVHFGVIRRQPARICPGLVDDVHVAPEVAGVVVGEVERCRRQFDPPLSSRALIKVV